MARRLKLSRNRVEDERGSIVMALLLILVGTMLAGLLVPLVVLQSHTAQFDTRRGHSLDAAQAGIDIAIGRIRAANDGTSANNGNLSQLPCPPLTGSLSTGGTARYQATVHYFAQDPHGHPDWVDDASKQLACLDGRGVSQTPAFAVIVSVGTDSASGSFTSVPTRTVQATYVFETQDSNVAGGLIHAVGSSPDLCLDAGSSSPAAGALVSFQTCNTGLDQQSWSFNTNLTVSLVSSSSSATDLGLCLDAAYTQTAGNPLTLQKCSDTTASDQQWSYNGSRNFVATNVGGTQSGLCWNAQNANTVNAHLVLGGCGTSSTSGFVPAAAVGAGNAGAGQKMLVNYNQFGRCLDVTGEQLPSNPSFLISYPCKVTPDGTKPPANQQWTVPAIPSGQTSATGTITSIQGNNTYCLISRSTSGYPYMDLCSKAIGNSATWKITGQTGLYTNSYQIIDQNGDCLQATDPNDVSPDVYVNDGTFSKIIVAKCSGSTLQKWNAPPGVDTAPVQDYQEK